MISRFRDPEVPLVVDDNIELPQLALIKNYTADCTQVLGSSLFLFEQAGTERGFLSGLLDG